MCASVFRRTAGLFGPCILLMSVVSGGHARADDVGCNADISKHSARLIKSHEARIKRCLKRATSRPCTPSDQHVDAAESKLRATITKPGGDCEVAVNGGVPFSQLGPGDTCPASHTRCDETVGTIASLQDLSECLICMIEGVATDAESRMASSNRFSDPNESKCIRSLFNVAIKAARKGRNQVERCARGLAQPISCPADDDPTGKFGKLLAKILKKVNRCKDASGVRGELGLDFTETLCRDGSFPSNAELSECYENTARCVACLYSNRVFGQSQDCSLFAATGCRGTSWVTGMTYVANQGDDTVTFYGTDGLPINGTAAASSFAVGPSPADVATSSRFNVVYSLNAGDGTVTYLDGSTGEPYLGTLASSTFAVGPNPVSVEAAGRLSRPALYVLDGTEEVVTLLHPTTGKFLNGDQSSSTFPVGSDPRSVGINKRDVVIVSNFGDDTVTAFDSDTADYLSGDLAGSTYSVGDGPTQVTRDQSTISFSLNSYVANSLDDTVTKLSPTTGQPESTFPVPGTPIGLSLGGMVPGHFRTLWTLTSAADLVVFDWEGNLGMTTEVNSIFAIAGSPSDVRYNPGSDNVHLLLPGTNELATFPANISNDSALDFECSNSVIADIAVDEVNDRLYMGCRNGAVLVFDASGTPAYAFGTEEDSTFSFFSLGTLQEVEVDGVTGVLYVSFIDTGGDGLNLAYADATTGAHLGASPFISRAPSSQLPRAPIVLDSSRNTLYTVDPQAQALLYLDATTGSYLNGTLAASSLALGDNPIDLAIDRTAGIVYALIDGVTDYVVYADADSVAYVGADLAASSIPTEPTATQIAASASAGLAYVANGDDGDTVTYLDGASPAYMNGSLAASTFAVIGAETLAVDPVAGRLYVGGLSVSGSKGTTTILDAVTGAYVNGTLASSQFPMLRPALLAANSSNGTYINASDFAVGESSLPESIMYFDGATGAPVDWGPDITTAPTGPSPSALAVMR